MKFDKEPIKVLARYSEDLPATIEDLKSIILDDDDIMEQISLLCKDKDIKEEDLSVCMYYSYNRQGVIEEIVFLRDHLERIWEVYSNEDEETPTWYGYKEGKMFAPSTSVWKVFIAK